MWISRERFSEMELIVEESRIRDRARCKELSLVYRKLAEAKAAYAELVEENKRLAETPKRNVGFHCKGCKYLGEREDVVTMRKEAECALNFECKDYEPIKIKGE